jgi:excisionase family DNA binding protein
MESLWLTVQEAASYLKVNPRTLCRWVREKKVPSHSLSALTRNVWRFQRVELDAMLCVSSVGPAERKQH